MTKYDKFIERERYDARARLYMAENELLQAVSLGSQSIPAYLRAPYLLYEKKIGELIQPHHCVLELGSGTGMHTLALVQTGAQIIASDISEFSLKLLEQRFQNIPGRLDTKIADMENLPFENSSFDVIVSAGSLSYGDNQVVLSHILRLLKPGGYFICVDSLNHNPFYRINRYIHFLQGDRSYSTLQRMPSVGLIGQYQTTLGGASCVHYFGGISWLIMLLAKFGFENFWANKSDRIDRLCRVRRSAFKFVLTAKKGI